MTSTKQLLNAGRGHQAPRKAAHSLPKEVAQFIKDNEAKELGTTETHPGEGIVKERFPHSRKPSHRQICEEFWNLRGQHNWEEKKKKNTTEYAPNHNCQHRSSPDAHLCHQQVAAWQGGKGCMLRIRTWPECPEDNLRELTWDSNPNCRIAREKKKRERENFPAKGSNLMCNLALSQNKGLREHQRKASRLHTGPSPTTGGREAGEPQPELEGKGQSQPQRWHPPATCEQALSC